MSTQNERWAKALDPNTPLKPEDTLAYYETVQVDPTLSLSDKERAQIDKWMAASENASSEPDTPVLSGRDKAYLSRLDRKANSLPQNNDDFVPPVDFYAALDDLYSRVYTWVKGTKWTKFPKRTK